MSSASKRSIFWFRRDLRLADNPALLAAIAEADEIVPVFIMDDAIAKRAGDFRRASHTVFRKEIAWREFYADVLHHNPHTSREYYASRFAKMRNDEPKENFHAWYAGTAL